MTKIELKKASEPLSKYAQKARKGPVIVVKRGKPFATVVPIRNADGETQVPGDHRALAISYKKGRRDFVQRTPPPAWPKKIVILTFENSRNVEVPPGTRADTVGPDY